MMNTRKTLSLVIAFGITASVFLTGLASAAPANQLTVSPALVNVELSDANPVQKTQIAITNTYLSDIPLTAELRGIDEISGKLVPTGSVDPMIAQNIVLSKTDFIATAKRTTIFEVLVRNSGSLSPGGHYATLVLKQKQQQQSVYSSEISISVFIVKLGGERQDVNMKVLDVRQSLVSLPQNIKVSFTNGGNTLVTPRASAIVSTSTSAIVSKGVANISSLPLLPGKSLTTNIELKQTSFRWFPQKLALNISYRSDGSEVVKQYQRIFWYVPPVFLIAIMFLSTLLFISTRHLLGWKKSRVNTRDALPRVQEFIEPEMTTEIVLPINDANDSKEKSLAITLPQTEKATIVASNSVIKVVKKTKTTAKKKTTASKKKPAKPKEK